MSTLFYSGLRWKMIEIRRKRQHERWFFFFFYKVILFLGKDMRDECKKWYDKKNKKR